MTKACNAVETQFEAQPVGTRAQEINDRSQSCVTARWRRATRQRALCFDLRHIVTKWALGADAYGPATGPGVGLTTRRRVATGYFVDAF